MDRDRDGRLTMRAWLIAILAAISALATDHALRAADDPRAQNELLQAALQACQQQTSDANARALERIAQLTVSLQTAQVRIRELEATAPKAAK